MHQHEMSYTLNRVTLWGEESTYETDVERIEREHEAELAAAPCDEVEVGA